MSAHVIEYQGGAKVMRPVGSREEYLALRGSVKQRTVLSVVRHGEPKAKKQLVQMNYSCLPEEGGALKGCRRASGSVGMDIDFVADREMADEERAAWMEEQMARVPELVLGKKEELGLLMMERSASKGFHIVFRRRAGLSQEENLRWASEVLGVKYDEGAKDLTRVFFTTSASEEDLLYLDDALFDNEPPLGAVAEKAVEEAPERRCRHHVKAGAPAAERRCRGHVEHDEEAAYDGMPFRSIVETYWKMFNGGREPVEGDRNVKTYELAMTLRSICGYSLERMLAVIPNYWGKEGEDEWRQTIENTLKEPRKGMPYRLRQVLNAMKGTAGVRACGGTPTSPPPMPKKLPPLLRLLTRNVPAFYKPAVANAVFPALGAHLHGVKFRYWDNVEHEATFMNVLIGRQSIGKGAIKKPIEFIMEDIRQRDLPNRQREAEWKQRNPYAKQKKEARPADICIQMLIDNLTDAVFNQRIVDAHNNGERYIFTFVDEIEALKKVTSRGTADEVGLLIRKAFDNSLSGQERVGADSVSGIAPLRWNFNASTTPPNARRFFAKMVNDGTVSRLDVSTIIRSDDEDEMPILGIYDNAFAAELKPYLDRLSAASGLIECMQARRLSFDMARENLDTARLYDSEAYRVFSYRANVIAWLKGMVLYVAHGCRWDKTIADFVRWTAQYNLWCKMLYFGVQMEKELREEMEIQRQSGPQNLLDLLAEEFTKEQYQQMRQSQGKDNSLAALRQWCSRGYVVHDEATGRYVKTEEYKKKFGKTR